MMKYYDDITKEEAKDQSPVENRLPLLGTELAY
jgi:hypothetical protein